MVENGKEPKRCPLAIFGNTYMAPCIKDSCELWLESVFSTEGILQPGRCSIRFMAEKNDEGKLPV